MDFMLGLIGLAGGILCALADIFLDLKGKGNQKSGKYKLIDSNWINMAEWRFPLSIAIAALAVPMYYMGLVAMGNQIRITAPVLARIFLICATVGSMGGLFIHASLCYLPIIYKKLSKDGHANLAEELIDKIFHSVKIPFFTLYLILVFATSIIVVIAILNNYLSVTAYCALLNPVIFMIVGVPFRKFLPNLCSDLPSICMPSLGLGMIGLTAALNTLS